MAAGFGWQRYPKLLEANRALLAAVSHELRSPLGRLRVLAELDPMDTLAEQLALAEPNERLTVAGAVLMGLIGLAGSVRTLFILRIVQGMFTGTITASGNGLPMGIRRNRLGSLEETNTKLGLNDVEVLEMKPGDTHTV